jgi:hypothetical protein
VSTTAVELYGIITNLIKTLEQRMNDRYFENRTHLILNQFIDHDENKDKELEESFELFIEVLLITSILILIMIENSFETYQFLIVNQIIFLNEIFL